MGAYTFHFKTSWQLLKISKYPIIDNNRQVLYKYKDYMSSSIIYTIFPTSLIVQEDKDNNSSNTSIRVIGGWNDNVVFQMIMNLDQLLNSLVDVEYL